MRSLLTIGVLGLASSVSLGQVLQYKFVGTDGLRGEADFELVSPTTISVHLRNVSTGAPSGFGASDQLLTSISFDLGAAGQNASDPMITGGSVTTGATSSTFGYGSNNVGPNSSVSGEWGYNNTGTTGLFPNLASSTVATGAIRFDPGQNLGGPPSGGLDGPEGGLLADPAVVSPGGQAGVQNEVVILFNLDSAISDLSFLDNGTRIEWGSDAQFTDGMLVPAPGSAAFLAVSGLLVARRRR